MNNDIKFIQVSGRANRLKDGFAVVTAEELLKPLNVEKTLEEKALFYDEAEEEIEHVNEQLSDVVEERNELKQRVTELELGLKLLDEYLGRFTSHKTQAVVNIIEEYNRIIRQVNL